MNDHYLTPTPTKPNGTPMVFGNGFSVRQSESNEFATAPEGQSITITTETLQQAAASEKCDAAFYTVYHRETREIIAARCFKDNESGLKTWIQSSLPLDQDPKNFNVELNHAKGHGGRATAADLLKSIP